MNEDRYAYRHHVTQYAMDAARLGVSLASAFDRAFELSAQYPRDDKKFVEALTQDLEARKQKPVEV